MIEDGWILGNRDDNTICGDSKITFGPGNDKLGVSAVHKPAKLI
jgi:hypothetical protein